MQLSTRLKLLRHLLTKTHLRLSIRQQLLMVSMVLLVIPIIGLQYVHELEGFLRQDLESRLLENAKVIATVLTTQSSQKREIEATNDQSGQNHRFIRSLAAAVLLDGYDDDWRDYFSWRETYPIASIQAPTLAPTLDPLEFSLLAGHHQRKLYFYLQVKDKHLVYRDVRDLDLEACDHLTITTQTRNGMVSNYFISTPAPGRIQALTVVQRQNAESEDPEPDIHIEPRITAVWLETPTGYAIELAVPDSLIGTHLALRVVDVDDTQQRQRRQVLSATTTADESLTSITTPSAILDSTLQQFALPTTRAWLLNRNAQILAVSGSIYDDNLDRETAIDEAPPLTPLEAVYGFIRLLYQAILPEPTEFFIDDTARASTLKGAEVDIALSGSPATMWRLTRDQKVNILRVVQPVMLENRVLGAVAVERNSNSILLLQNRAMEILLNTSVLVFLVSTLTLVAFAARLSYRIGRLRDDAEAVIAADGRVTGDMPSSYELDELGDLRRSYVAMLERLKEYNRYLEGMASKLSHELRTPVTVVKSSLENLELSRINSEDHTYIERAREGVDRLNHILTRMSEATRLEQTLISETKQRFPLAKVVSGCVGAYQGMHPGTNIRYQIEAPLQEKTLFCDGSPDLIAQMLDKLVNNAMDFAITDTPVDVVIGPCVLGVAVYVRNCGPLLPESMQANLFDSMVSVRQAKQNVEAGPHLGLGLYIVRLIAEFHAGRAFARNIGGTSTVKNAAELPCQGVEIGVELPLS